MKKRLFGAKIGRIYIICAHKVSKYRRFGCEKIQTEKIFKKSVDKRVDIVYNRYCCEGHDKTKSRKTDQQTS